MSLLPVQLRQSLRHGVDSLYCKPFPDKETIGDICPWTIRIHDLNRDSVVYSGGVGADISFELELIRRFGVTIQIFDPSPVAEHTINRVDSTNLRFKPMGLAGTDAASFSIGGDWKGDGAWFKKGGEGELELPCTTLIAEMMMNGHDHIDLLKIDIEGFEYEVLDACAEIPIRQICVEFHDFYQDVPRSKTRNSIRSLKSHGYQLIHKHRYEHTFYKFN